MDAPFSNGTLAGLREGRIYYDLFWAHTIHGSHSASGPRTTFARTA
jgi:hypothetical protein